MTIKRRLVISNILMIVIPALIALVIALGSMYITWYWVRQMEKKIPELNFSYDEIIDLASKSIDSKTSSKKLESMLDKLSMNVVVYDKEGNEFTFGNEVIKSTDKLLKAEQILQGDGYIGLENEDMYTQQKTVNGVSYTFCLLTNFQNDNSYIDYSNILDTRLVIVVVATIISIILAIIVTNHFLTRFVFQKIRYSLDLLADGVHEIKDGNLDHKIVYTNNDEFMPVCEDFNNMADRLNESIKLTQKQEQNRKELLAGISHDLRSPLTSIKAYVEGLMDGVARTPEAQQNYMQMIKTKAEDIDQMVSQLFLFSKMDMGDYPYYPETLDLHMEVTSYVNATKEEYSAKGLKISITSLEPDIYIYADPIQLRRVFTNIIENSVKYKDSPEADMSLSVQSKGNIVQIQMEDNGPGVPDEALDKIFDVFYRIDSSRSNPNHGSGLGLAITAKSVAQMGGTIYAQNREQGGLRIIIDIPMATKEKTNEKSTDN